MHSFLPCTVQVFAEPTIHYDWKNKSSYSFASIQNCTCYETQQLVAAEIDKGQYQVPFLDSTSLMHYTEHVFHQIAVDFFPKDHTYLQPNKSDLSCSTFQHAKLNSKTHALMTL